jgi:tRNA modification GTPase
MPLHVVDTAGLRESEDIVELEGISRAWGEINQADRILLVIDDGKGITNDDEQILDKLSQDNSKLTIVRNKIDISGASAAMKEGPMGTELYLSARQGEGMDILLNHLKDCMGYQSAGEGGFIARRRHLDALQRVQKFVDKGQEQLQDQGAGELLAEDLRQAQQAVSEITGEFTNEDLLDKIFSSFCIGK